MIRPKRFYLRNSFDDASLFSSTKSTVLLVVGQNTQTQNTQTQNSQTQNTQSPKILKPKIPKAPKIDGVRIFCPMPFQRLRFQPLKLATASVFDRMPFHLLELSTTANSNAFIVE